MSQQDMLFEEALKWRMLARDMRMLIGTAPCECVETPEYIEYMKHFSTLSKGERLLHPSFEGRSTSEECQRCKALYRYEQVVGVDEMFAESPNKMHPEEREAFKRDFVEALIEYFKNKEENN